MRFHVLIRHDDGFVVSAYCGIHSALIHLEAEGIDNPTAEDMVVNAISEGAFGITLDDRTVSVSHM